MYRTVLKDELWWIISDDGKILDELGSFIDPISPKIIAEELNGELQLRCEQGGICKK